MIVVKPYTVDQTTLTSSSIPEPDAGETVWSAGTYNTGTRRINTTTHRVYEVVAVPSTSDDPLVGVDADPPTWVDVSATNRYAMFDNLNGSQSTDGANLDVSVTIPAIINSVSGFNVSGVDTVTINVTDAVEGLVYTNTIDLNDNEAVVDFYQYFFEPIAKKDEFIDNNLPAYFEADIDVMFDGTACAVGSLVLGKQIPLGVTTYGTSFQLLDFSRKERDAFGNYIITEGRTSKLVDFDLYADTNKLGYIFRELAKLTTTPAVWSGKEDDQDDPTLVFGYYRDSQINIDFPEVSDISIQIEGLT